MITSDITDIPINEYHLPAKNMIIKEANFLEGRQVVPFLIQLDQQEYPCLKSDKEYFDKEMQKEITDANSIFKIWGGIGLTSSGCGGYLMAVANSKKNPTDYLLPGMLLSTFGLAFLGVGLLVKGTAFPKEAAKAIAIDRLIRLEAKERAIEKRLSELTDNSDNAEELEQLQNAKKYFELVRTIWDREHTPKGNSYISVRTDSHYHRLA